MLGLDALWVSDPAPSKKPGPLVKGWGVKSFLLLCSRRRPSHIQPHRDASRQERRENGAWFLAVEGGNVRGCGDGLVGLRRALSPSSASDREMFDKQGRGGVRGCRRPQETWRVAFGGSGASTGRAASDTLRVTILEAIITTNKR